jgi:hypothetical protein
MSNSNEPRLRGTNLGGAEQKVAVDHAAYAKNRKTDAELHLDEEKDTLHDDGLDIEDDSETLAGTRGNTNHG